MLEKIAETLEIYSRNCLRGFTENMSKEFAPGYHFIEFKKLQIGFDIQHNYMLT